MKKEIVEQIYKRIFSELIKANINIKDADGQNKFCFGTAGSIETNTKHTIEFVSFTAFTIDDKELVDKLNNELKNFSKTLGFYVQKL